MATKAKETATAAANEPTATATAAAIVPVTNGGAVSTLQVFSQISAIERMGQIFWSSGFFGGSSKVSQATAALVNCAIEGLSPIQYRAKYNTMDDGTPTVKSDFIQREFHRLGGKWKFNEWTAEVCDLTFTYQGEELRGRVTLDEFKKNGVAIGKSGSLKTNWAKFPKEMLKARCMATYIRAICPEALGGLYTDTEAQDFTPAQTTTPPPVQATAAAQVVDAEIVDATPPTPPDYGVCPCGKAKGKRFAELSTETLENILATDPAKVPAVTEGHRDAIKAILIDREVAAQD